MMMDVDQAAKAMRDEEMAAEIEDFLEGFKQPTYRGMRVNGVRSMGSGWRPGAASTAGAGCRAAECVPCRTINVLAVNRGQGRNLVHHERV